MKVEDVKRPLKKGEIYEVPCLVRYDTLKEDEQLVWMDLNKTTKTMMFICPVINHPHNDKENGQLETHYHTDYRFVKYKMYGSVIRKHSKHIFADTSRPTTDYGELKYFKLPVINEDFVVITNVDLIKNSKLKHKCIHKGKCPHRGYDLSQVKPDENGIITCPLHGLKFNNKTKKLIK